MSVAVINYGMGNLASVINAFQSLRADPYIAHMPEELSRADAICLPGVGSFSNGINNLKRGNWIEAMEEEVKSKGKPFLGICLGMHLLASLGTEHGRHQGLGWIRGQVLRIDNTTHPLRIPHIGWNEVYFGKDSRLFTGLDSPKDFYFLHSYVFIPKNNTAVSGRCVYGEEFAASIELNNIYATQFHPEKSHQAGLAVLKNFLSTK